MTELRIDKADREQPLYRQIADRIISGIRERHLEPGGRLPTVRELAEELEVTRVTAHNAYRFLSSEGWIDATVGRGTFVAERPPLPAPPASSSLSPDAVMAGLCRAGRARGVRSLGMAEPDHRSYPVDDFMAILHSMHDELRELFDYGPTDGDGALREAVSTVLRPRGLTLAAEDVLITSGVTQGLSIVTAALSEPGQTVLVEEPTYLGFISLLESYGLRPLGVPLDDEGARLDVLERFLLRERPSFFYTIPTFHNPTGISMTEDRRAGLLALASEYGLTIVEDNIYGRLAYDGPAPSLLKARDEHDLVVYLDGFSKALLPGIRTGYVIAPPALRPRLSYLLRTREMGGSTFLQRALALFLSQGLYDAHVERVLPTYRKRRNALVAALSEHMPPEVSWTHPSGGYCCWLSLPENGDFTNLHRMALSRGVLVTPGDVFFTRSPHRSHLRICFGGEDERVLGEAVRVLADCIGELLERPATTAGAPMTRPIV